jgi:NADPH-dependent 2,4-dienoyl-CoA reductase/sulfur reductase-like enzyme
VVPDWSRKLLKPVEIGKRKLRTLHDLRAHLLTLPEEIHDKPVWRAATEAVLKAAEGGDVQRAAETFRLARFVHRDQ